MAPFHFLRGRIACFLKSLLWHFWKFHLFSRNMKVGNDSVKLWLRVVGQWGGKIGIEICFSANFFSLWWHAYYIFKAESLTGEEVVEFTLHAKPRLFKRRWIESAVQFSSVVIFVLLERSEEFYSYIFSE